MVSAVGHSGLAALETDLHMTKAGIRQRREFLPCQQHGGGDEIGVKSDIARVLNQFDQVLARCRLTAGEMNLQHADLGKFGQDFFPFLGRELAAGALQLNRIGAIGATAADSDASARPAPRAECQGFLPLSHAIPESRPHRPDQ